MLNRIVVVQVSDTTGDEQSDEADNQKNKCPMSKIRMLIEVEMDAEITDDEEQMYYENEIFVGDGNLLIHSNEIGDTVGVVKSCKNIQWYNQTNTHVK